MHVAVGYLSCLFLPFSHAIALISDLNEISAFLHTIHSVAALSFYTNMKKERILLLLLLGEKRVTANTILWAKIIIIFYFIKLTYIVINVYADTFQNLYRTRHNVSNTQTHVPKVVVEKSVMCKVSMNEKHRRQPIAWHSVTHSKPPIN